MAVSEVAGGIARIDSILGDDASLLAARVQDDFERTPCTCLAGTSSTACARSPTDPRRCSPT